MEWMFLLGLATGMRSMTPIAVVCWFAWRGSLHVENTWAFWAGNLITVIVFTVLALGEYIGDTLPRTPNRTSLFPAAARIVFGALCGAIIATAYILPVAGGVVFGALGAVVGTWGGFYLRRWLTSKVRRDLPVALLGSLAALLISYNAISAYLFWMNKHPVRYRDSDARLVSPSSKLCRLNARATLERLADQAERAIESSEDPNGAA